MPFISKGAEQGTEGGLPARRGPPIRGTAVPVSGKDLSSPTPTESDLDYAGYDMGGQSDQSDQLEGVIGESVSVSVCVSYLDMRACSVLIDEVYVHSYSSFCPFSAASFLCFSYLPFSSPYACHLHMITTYRLMVMTII